VCRLSQSLGVDGSAETKSDTGTEELAVSQSSDTLVVDLGFDKSVGVKLVLASDFQTDAAGVSALRIPSSLSTGLNLSVHAVVVRGSEDAEVVGGSDSSGVLRDTVSNGGRVLSDLSPVNIVANFSTSEEAVVANNSITVKRRSLQQVEESAGVEEGLAEVEVELSTLAFAGGEELGEDFSLKPVGNGVVKLDLGVQSVEGGPCLGQSQACKVCPLDHKTMLGE